MEDPAVWGAIAVIGSVFICGHYIERQLQRNNGANEARHVEPMERVNEIYHQLRIGRVIRGV